MQVWVWGVLYLSSSTTGSITHLDSLATLVNLLGSDTVNRSLEVEVCGLRPKHNTGEMARIVGGLDAKEGEVPWQAMLILDGHLECGGALISSRALVTAAHCLKQPASQYTVVVGRLAAPSPELECHQQNFKAIDFFAHPDYDPRTLINDVAVVSIASLFGQGARWTPSVLPLCLAAPGTSSGAPASPRLLWEEGELGLVSGYGLTKEEGKSAKTLQEAVVPVVSRARCSSAYRTWIAIDPIHQFCAGGGQGGRDACTGDSGGPLATSAEGRFYLAGVVSFGKGCGRRDFPGVYTRIEPYIPWLLGLVNRIHQGSPTLLEVGQRPNTTAAPIITSSTIPNSLITTTSSTPTPTAISSHSTTSKPIVTTQMPKSTSAPPILVGPVCSGYYRVIRCPRGQVGCCFMTFLLLKVIILLGDQRGGSILRSLLPPRLSVQVQGDADDVRAGQRQTGARGSLWGKTSLSRVDKT